MKERIVKIDLKLEKMEIKNAEEVFITSNWIMVDTPGETMIIPQHKIVKIKIIGPVKVHGQK